MTTLLFTILNLFVYAIPSMVLIIFLWKKDIGQVRTKFEFNVKILFACLVVSSIILSSIMVKLTTQIMYKNRMIEVESVLLEEHKIAPLEDGNYFIWESEETGTKISYAQLNPDKTLKVQSTELENQVAIRYVDSNFKVEKKVVKPRKKIIYQVLGLTQIDLAEYYVFYVPFDPK